MQTVKILYGLSYVYDQKDVAKQLVQIVQLTLSFDFSVTLCLAFKVGPEGICKEQCRKGVTKVNVKMNFTWACDYIDPDW